MAFTWKEIFLFISSLLMIVVVLLQDSKEDAGTAFTGEKSGLFSTQKVRGFDFFMTIATLVIAVMYVTFAILAIAL